MVSATLSTNRILPWIPQITNLPVVTTTNTAMVMQRHHPLVKLPVLGPSHGKSKFQMGLRDGNVGGRSSESSSLVWGGRHLGGDVELFSFLEM
jgi:hypothetical protein